MNRKKKSPKKVLDAQKDTFYHQSVQKNPPLLADRTEPAVLVGTDFQVNSFVFGIIM